ncbi:MAG: SUMF1/EgtB/PvdO family nonheme iron enzyme [Anaerolineae bacterium]|nr:SUMF1/EgtB/PvdO family nonheme iron enzyme [Anaerolineae bacterium]
MSKSNRPLKVFLSYASQDKPLVRELSRRLAGEGWIDTWQDEKSLLPGQDWRVKIEEAVEDADAVIICLSNHSVTKEGHVQKELRYAREIALEKPEDAIFLIPLRLEDCEIPRGLRFYQWVDYFEEKKDASYIALVASLKLRYEQKLKLEEEERLRKKQQELETAAKAAREKEEQEAAERERIKADKEERKKIAKKKAELETVKREYENGKNEPPTRRQSVYWFGGFIFLVLGIIFLSSLNSPSSAEQPTPENTQTQTIVTLSHNTTEASITKTPEATSTAVSITLAPTNLPTEIIDAEGLKMRLVPAGEFKMGSENWESDEAPIHQVYLDAYYMDVYEVTNIAYIACVNTGYCYKPAYNYSLSRTNYYGYSEFNDFPVVYVDWTQASLFCSWRGASLPTEAQWEKAARGTDERIYPWGNEVDCSKANYFDETGGCNRTDTAKVGSYEDGKSPYGIYDLSGNVWEWVADWYSETYYQNSPLKNPSGPGLSGSQLFRVLRGGAWHNNAMRSSNRLQYLQYASDWNIGFRCVKNVNP